VIDSVFRDRLRKVSTLGPETEATVVGRLQMGDFSPAALRCRIDTFAGSVLADFGDELRDSVLDAMDQMVMATGTAELQPDGSTVRVLHLSALERLPSARMSPLATLQREQQVTPVRHIAELRGSTEEGDETSPQRQRLIGYGRCVRAPEPGRMRSRKSRTVGFRRARAVETAGSAARRVSIVA
jgi:hypothetical protein